MSPWLFRVPGNGPIKLDSLEWVMDELELKGDSTFYWWDTAQDDWVPAQPGDLCGNAETKVLLAREVLLGCLSRFPDWLKSAADEKEVWLEDWQLKDVFEEPMM